MQAFDGAGGCCDLRSRGCCLEQDLSLCRRGQRGVEGIRHPAERTDIIRIRGYVAGQAMLGESRRSPLGGRRQVGYRMHHGMHEQVQQEQER